MWLWSPRLEDFARTLVTCRQGYSPLRLFEAKTGKGRVKDDGVNPHGSLICLSLKTDRTLNSRMKSSVGNYERPPQRLPKPERELAALYC